MNEYEKELQKFNKQQEEFDKKLKILEQKESFKAQKSILKFGTYTKNLVAAIIGICILDLQLTYLLAFLGKTSIAESLSQSLCNTILGVAFIYIIRAYFDTKAEMSNINNDINKDGKIDIKEATMAVMKKLKKEANKAIEEESSIPIDEGEYDNLENIEETDE